MSYLVCHIEKYTKGSVFGLQKHEQRENENYSNKEIKIEESKNNLNLLRDEKINYLKEIDRIIKENKTSERAIRKDAVLCVSSIISSDREFFNNLTEHQTNEFFRSALEFYKEKFGEENIVSAIIHKDETTPHMHINFVPITKDGRLSAKSIINRNSLRKIQKELPKYLQEKGFNIERGVEGNKVKHIKTIEYKKQMTKKINDIENVVQNARKVGLFKKQVTMSVEDYDTLINLSREGLNTIETNRENSRLETKVDNLKNDVINERELREYVSNDREDLNKKYKRLTQGYRELERINSRNVAVYNDLNKKYNDLGERYVTLVESVNKINKMNIDDNIKEIIKETAIKVNRNTNVPEPKKDIEQKQKTHHVGFGMEM